MSMLENQTPEQVLGSRGGRVLQTDKMSTPQVDLTLLKPEHQSISGRNWQNRKEK